MVPVNADIKSKLILHACRLVEDVLSFSSSQSKFSPPAAADCVELLTTGHAIAAGTIIGSLADGSIKMNKVGS